VPHLESHASVDVINRRGRGASGDAPAYDLARRYTAPFQTLSFLALSVIPKLKITDRGLIDVDAFDIGALEAP
jgi:hypothetical protein